MTQRAHGHTIVAQGEQTEVLTPEQVLAAILDELRACLGSISTDAARPAVEALATTATVFCAGAGRSGLAMRAFAMRLMHMGRDVHFVGDVTTPGIRSGDLLVIGSGSGSTASLRAAAEKARGLGAKILLFTIDPTSPIGQMADAVVEIPAPSPKAAGGGRAASKQPMGSLFEQALFLTLDAIVWLLMCRLGLNSGEMFGRHANLE